MFAFKTKSEQRLMVRSEASSELTKLEDWSSSNKTHSLPADPRESVGQVQGNGMLADSREGKLTDLPHEQQQSQGGSPSTTSRITDDSSTLTPSGPEYTSRRMHDGNRFARKFKRWRKHPNMMFAAAVVLYPRNIR